MKVLSKDTSTLCVVGGLSEELQKAKVVKIGDKVLNVTYRTPYQLAFKGQSAQLVLKGSKESPVEIEVTIVE